jgi:hypothetical protein
LIQKYTVKINTVDIVDNIDKPKFRTAGPKAKTTQSGTASLGSIAAHYQIPNRNPRKFAIFVGPALITGFAIFVVGPALIIYGSRT